MKLDAHQQAALDIEQTIGDLGDPVAKAYIRRTIIIDYWGAAFQWLAYGCERKYGLHNEKHQGLARFLRDQGEAVIAQAWEGLESVRNGGWYGAHPTLENVNKAQAYWQEVRLWALS